MSNQNSSGHGRQPGPDLTCSHIRMKPTTAPQSAYLCMTQERLVQNPVPAEVLGDAIPSVQAKSTPVQLVPDLRSPLDCYHSEAYLIGCLVKLYGWRVIEPGLLRRRWNGPEVAAALEVA